MWRSKASYGTVNTRPLIPTEACVVQKSARLQFWRWTALPDRAAPVPRTQIQLMNLSNSCVAEHRTLDRCSAFSFKAEGMALSFARIAIFTSIPISDKLVYRDKAWANTLRIPETYNDRGLIGFPYAGHKH